MLSKWYARRMFAWETALTTRDENRIVRPMEWGFEWLDDFLRAHKIGSASQAPADPERAEEWMTHLNEVVVRESDSFFNYEPPTDYRLEERHPQLFPTNVRPETLAQDAKLKEMAEKGELEQAQFLRFTSPVCTPYPENDLVNARWYPAPAEKQVGKPKQAIIVMPQWKIGRAHV